MYYFFRYPYGLYRPTRYVVNPVRCVEAFLCVGCLVLAVIFTVTEHNMHTTFKVVLMVTAAAFATITIVDIISTSYSKPIYWGTWTLFATTGAIFFSLCVGVLIATGSKPKRIIAIGEIINAVTAIMFLLDCLLVLHAFRKISREVHPQDIILQEKEYEDRKTQTEGTEMFGGPMHDERHEPETREPAAETIVAEPKREEEIPEVGSEEITLEERYETKRYYDDGLRRIQELESEHRLQYIEPPGSGKQRQSISYGGTFPMSKDAAPLPSPEPLPRPRAPRRRSSIYCAGPCSTQVQKSPSARDEVPAVSTEETPYVEPCNCHVLTYRDGDYFTPSGQKVTKVYKGPDGKLIMPDGTPLRKIQTGTKTIYESPDGFIYNPDGTPIYANMDMEKDTLRIYQQRSRGFSVRSETRLHEEEHQRGAETVRSQNLAEVTEIHRSRDRGPTSRSANRRQEQTEVTQWQKTPSPGYRSSEALPTVGEPRTNREFDESPKSYRYFERSGQRPIPFTSRDTSRTVEVLDDSESRAYSERSAGLDREQDEGALRPYGENTGRLVRIQKTTAGRTYLQDGTPLTETRTSSGGLMYEGPDGELFTRDGAQVSSSLEEAKLAERCPCYKKQTSPRQISRSPVRSSLQDLSQPVDHKEPSVSSRTVAISTRMVPKSNTAKCQKCLSAPGSPDTKEPTTRSVKSAESPQSSVVYQYQQQQPAVVYHQYVQKPCHCGRVHYQTATTVHGTVCNTTCPSYMQHRAIAPAPAPEPVVEKPKPSPPPPPPAAPKKTCSPQTPCGKKDCVCCSCKKKEEPVLQLPPPEPLDKPSPPLQTISECECETEPSSIWGDQVHLDATPSASSSQPTSSDYAADNIASSSCEKCYVCGDKSCTIHRKKSTGNDSVQTSETRMLRASDVQRMNTNLPGSADHYRK